MPTYEYECRSCQHRFELRQGFDAEPVESCPLCQGSSRRMFHSPTIIYKGSGFYTTDYAKKSYSSPGTDSEPEKPLQEKEASSKEE